METTSQVQGKKKQKRSPPVEPDSEPEPEPEPEEPLQPGQCPECFYAPCIAVQNADVPFLGDGAAASPYNSAIRNGLYRRFWALMDNTGGWDFPQYKAKKIRLGGIGRGILNHRRQVMPGCVTALLRGKYPNPQDMPYQGHHWTGF